MEIRPSLSEEHKSFVPTFRQMPCFGKFSQRSVVFSTLVACERLSGQNWSVSPVWQLGHQMEFAFLPLWICRRSLSLSLCLSLPLSLSLSLMVRMILFVLHKTRICTSVSYASSNLQESRSRKANHMQSENNVVMRKSFSSQNS